MGPTYAMKWIDISKIESILETVKYDKWTRERRNLSERKKQKKLMISQNLSSLNNQIARASYNDIISGQPTDARDATLKHSNVFPVLIPECDQG